MNLIRDPPREKGTGYKPVGKVPYIRQSFNWDCGLACALMVLKSLGLRHYDMHTLRILCPCKSLWTIDVAHLLARCGIEIIFITSFIGANDAYAQERFYADSIGEDVQRVNQLFKEASNAGIRIINKSLTTDELQNLVLSENHLVIALVDKQQLENISSRGMPNDCTSCVTTIIQSSNTSSGQQQQQFQGHIQGTESSSGTSSSSENENLLSTSLAGSAAGAGTANVVFNNGSNTAAPDTGKAGSGGNYTGHYVVVVGYDPDLELFCIRDPAAGRKHVNVPVARFEAARKAFGTDEDLLVCCLPINSE